MAAPTLKYPPSMQGSGDNLAGSMDPGIDYADIAGNLAGVAQMAAQSQAQQNQFTMQLLGAQMQQNNDLLKMRMMLEDSSQNRFVQEQNAERERANDLYKTRVLENESVLQRMREDREARKQEFQQTVEFLKMKREQELMDLKLKQDDEMYGFKVRAMKRDEGYALREEQVMPQFLNAVNLLKSPGGMMKGLLESEKLLSEHGMDGMNPARRAELTSELHAARSLPVNGLRGGSKNLNQLAADMKGSDVEEAAWAMADVAAATGDDPAKLIPLDSPDRVIAAAQAKTYLKSLPKDLEKRQLFFAKMDELKKAERENETSPDPRKLKLLRQEVADLLPADSFLRASVMSPRATDTNIVNPTDVIESLGAVRNQQVNYINGLDIPAEAKARAIERVTAPFVAFGEQAETVLKPAVAAALSDRSSAKDRHDAIVKLEMTMRPVADALGLKDFKAARFVGSDTVQEAADFGLGLGDSKPMTMEELAGRIAGQPIVGTDRTMGVVSEGAQLLQASVGGGVLGLSKRAASPEPEAAYKAVSEAKQFAQSNPAVLRANGGVDAENKMAEALFPDVRGYRVDPRKQGAWGGSLVQAIEKARELAPDMATTPTDAVRLLIQKRVLIPYAQAQRYMFGELDAPVASNPVFVSQPAPSAVSMAPVVKGTPAP